MILTRPYGRGHPSHVVWQNWNNWVNANQGIFTLHDDFDSICDKLYDLLMQSGMKYISGDSVVRTATQILEQLPYK